MHDFVKKINGTYICPNLTIMIISKNTLGHAQYFNTDTLYTTSM